MVLTAEQVEFQWTCMDKVLTDKLYEYYTWMCWPRASSVHGDQWGSGWGSTQADALSCLNEQLAHTCHSRMN